MLVFQSFSVKYTTWCINRVLCCRLHVKALKQSKLKWCIILGLSAKHASTFLDTNLIRTCRWAGFLFSAEDWYLLVWLQQMPHFKHSKLCFQQKMLYCLLPCFCTMFPQGKWNFEVRDLQILHFCDLFSQWRLHDLFSFVAFSFFGNTTCYLIGSWPGDDFHFKIRKRSIYEYADRKYCSVQNWIY